MFLAIYAWRAKRAGKVQRREALWAGHQRPGSTEAVV